MFPSHDRQGESDGDRLHYSVNVFTASPPVKAIMTIDDEPAANSECWLSFRLDNAGSGDDPLFAVARHTDNNNFYGIGGYGGTTEGLSIFKVVSGTVTEITTATGGSNNLKANTADATYNAHVSDSTKELLEDGSSLLSTSDNALTSGKYGFAVGDWLDSANDIAQIWAIENVILVEEDSNLGVFDKFMTDATGTELDAHTPGPVGTAWTQRSGGTDTLDINQTTTRESIRGGTNTLNSGCSYTVTPAPSGADYDLHMAFNTRTGGSGADEPFWLIGRWTDTNNYYLAGLYPTSSGDLVLEKVVSGTATQLAANTSFSPSSTDGAMSLSITDAQKRARHSYQGTDTDITSSDNALTSSGNWGVGMGNIGSVSTDDLSDFYEAICFIAAETAAAAAANPKGPFGLALHGPFGGPV